MSTPAWVRYILLQVPGWIAVAVLAWIAAERDWLDPMWGVTATVVWIVKDAILYPFVKTAYQSGKPGHGQSGLIGKEGTAVDPLEPDGYVRVEGRLWKARAVDTTHPISAGETITVTSEKGLLLLVRPGRPHNGR